LPAVWIHGGHKVDSGLFYQSLDVGIACHVLLAEVISQFQDQLATQDLVSVHISYIFKLRLHDLVVSRFRGKLNEIERKSQNRCFREGVDPGDVGTPVVDVLEHLCQFVIIVMFELELE
jgi:hypothetical protein